jgi:hypothetical protein
MRTLITLAKLPWRYGDTASLPPLEKLKTILLETFADFNARCVVYRKGTYNYPTFEVQAPVDDRGFKRVLKDFDQQVKKYKPAAAAAVFLHATPAETLRARFLEPYYYTSFVDEMDSRAPLNPEMQLCKRCQYPNFDYWPEPFVVNRSVQKAFDVFPTGVGMIIVRGRVLDLLRKMLGKEIGFGEAVVAESKAKAKPGEQLFWVRPRQVLGRRVRVLDGRTICPSCKRSVPRWLGLLDRQVNKVGPGVFDTSIRVENFGKASGDIGMIDNSATGNWPTLVMSGQLLAYLKENGVKGLTGFTNQNEPQCVFSEEGEPAFHPSERTIKAVPARKSANPPALESRSSMTSFSAVPWNCTKDGNVYFQLSGPEFVVLDPMTGEQNSDGPFKLKNFKGHGLYRIPVAAIKTARSNKRAIAVDSATLLFVDNRFLSTLLERYDWNKSVTRSGRIDQEYYEKVVTEVGTRFGICSPPPKRFKSDFDGDGFYTIDVRKIVRS